MCFVALDMSKEVKFAAVIDTNGKLIAGKQCKDDYMNNSLAKTRLLQVPFWQQKRILMIALTLQLYFASTIQSIFSIQIA